MPVIGLLIYHFLSSVFIKPMSTMLVFCGVYVCVGVGGVCVSVCVHVWQVCILK